MLDHYRFRCSSLGKIMTEPTAAAAKAGEVLSVGAKTYIRELVAQEVLGVDFEISGKPLEKGILVEPEAIALLNRVRGLSLVKNTERRRDDYIVGECDAFDIETREGYDTKAPWSVATFPIIALDAVNPLYRWQAVGYSRLWDAKRWHIAYALVDTPEHLIGYEPISMHSVGHIPEHHRLTVITYERDMEAEALMISKVIAARKYMAEVIKEFDLTHKEPGAAPIITKPTQPATTELPESIFG